MKLLKILFIFLTVNSFAQETQQVKWYTFEEAVKLNQQNPKKIFVDVYTNWCGWCKVMDKNTFGNDTIAEYLNDKYYPVKLNAEQKEDITIGDNTYKYKASGNRGYHELAAAITNGKLSYPTVVFLNEQLQIMHVQAGYQKKQPFDAMARYFGDNHYLDTDWESFKAAYKSPF